MTKQANITELLSVRGDGVDADITTAFTSNPSPFEYLQYAWTMGATLLFTPPTPTPSALYIVPAPGFAGVLTIKGNAGDVGVVISSTNRTRLSIDPGFAGIYVTSSLAASHQIWWA
jgi:hypothetical protein